MPDRMPWHPEGVGFVDLGVTEIGADTVSCQSETRVTWGRAHPDDPFTPHPGTSTIRLSNWSARFIPSSPDTYWPKAVRPTARLIRIQKWPRDPFDDRISAMHSAYQRKTKGRRP